MYDLQSVLRIHFVQIAAQTDDLTDIFFACFGASAAELGQKDTQKLHQKIHDHQRKRLPDGGKDNQKREGDQSADQTQQTVAAVDRVNGKLNNGAQQHTQNTRQGQQEPAQGVGRQQLVKGCHGEKECREKNDGAQKIRTSGFFAENPMQP